MDEGLDGEERGGEVGWWKGRRTAKALRRYAVMGWDGLVGWRGGGGGGRGGAVVARRRWCGGEGDGEARFQAEVRKWGGGEGKGGGWTLMCERRGGWMEGWREGGREGGMDALISHWIDTWIVLIAKATLEVAHDFVALCARGHEQVAQERVQTAARGIFFAPHAFERDRMHRNNGTARHEAAPVQFVTRPAAITHLGRPPALQK